MLPPRFNSKCLITSSGSNFTIWDFPALCSKVVRAQHMFQIATLRTRDDEIGDFWFDDMQIVAVHEHKYIMFDFLTAEIMCEKRKCNSANNRGKLVRKCR